MQKDVKLQELFDISLDIVSQVYSSDTNYKIALKAISLFHNYSASNCLLIAAQKPDATLVTGYNAWHNTHNRHVAQGEKGIEIISATKALHKSLQKRIGENGENVLDKNGLAVYDIVETQNISHARGFVFDVSQTVGEPIRQYNLQGIDSERINKAISIINAQNADEKQSISFVVKQYFDIDTPEYDFSRIISLASGKSLAQLREQLDVIRFEAHNLIKDIERTLERSIEPTEKEVINQEPNLRAANQPLSLADKLSAAEEKSQSIHAKQHNKSTEREEI